MTVTHIVWDWNCTLLDDFNISVAAAAAACAEVGGAPVDSHSYRRHFTRPVRNFYEALLARPVTDVEWRRIVLCYHDTYESLLPEVGLRAEAVEALRLARSAGLTQSLLSMGDHDAVSALVDHFALRPHFCLVQGADTEQRTEVKRDRLHRHIERAGELRGTPLTPGEVLLVGDTEDDMEAALAAGTRCALLSDGCFDPAAVDHPDVTVIDRLHEAVRPPRHPHPRPRRQAATPPAPAPPGTTLPQAP